MHFFCTLMTEWKLKLKRNEREKEMHLFCQRGMGAESDDARIH